MSSIIDGLLYTKNHEWVKVKGEKAYIGISDHAQEELGEIVYVELPELEEEFEKDSEIASIESVKAAAAVYAPISGIVISVNESLEDVPEVINEDPYKNYLFVMEITNNDELDELMDSDDYAAFIEESKG